MATQKKPTKKSAAPRKSSRGSARKPKKQPVRREVGGAVCLLLALFVGIGYFQHEAIFIRWLYDGWRGLTGWGWYAALPALLAAAPAPVHVSAADAAWCFTERNRLEPYAPVLSPPANLAEDLSEGAEVRAGGLVFRVLATPGHSPGSVCFLLGSTPGIPSVLFAGDTLFAGSIGRTDFEGGDDAAMAASLRRLASLPPETRVLPGHGPATTIARELRVNPYILSAVSQ